MTSTIGPQMDIFNTGWVQCPHCGEISANQFVHTINHETNADPNMCKKQLYVLRQLRITTDETRRAHLTAQAVNLNCYPGGK